MIFSVRMVSIDYYMSPPIPGLDLCYSSFQGGKVNEVPVIRVYGSTPAAQKTCLHVHRALPYLYVPCSDIPADDDDACVQLICHALEKALKLKGTAASKRQHVHSCTLVRAKSFYGYHTSDQLYAKIYLYHPQDVSRASKLLLDGSVLDKSLQPHESHIPFLLQFLVDYNLQGMGHLHVSKMKFRYPVPHAFTKKKSTYDGQHKQQMDMSFMSTKSKAESSGDVSLEPPIWLSSTIPETWMWHLPSQDPDDNIAKRQSVCELEGDAAIDDILNQQCKLYSSLSQTLSDVRMVQSLIPIWEEFKRTGIHMESISSDPEKPSPHTVLSALSNQVEFENKLLELCNAGDSLPCAPVNTGQMFSQSVRSSSDGRNVVNTGQILSQGHYSAEDSEALSLLNWLASSQAVEDINSDDELKRETILSPLMPATTISEVLEKADMEFIRASQQECQDILDSVQDSPDVECKTKSEASAMALDCNYYSLESSSKEEIPQVYTTKPIHHTRKTPKIQKNKGKRPLWGSLPLCSTENANVSENHIGTVSGAGSTIVGCSVRDLMRRKRNHRGESPKVEIHHDVKVTPDKQSKESFILSPAQMGDHQNVSPISTNLTDGPTAVGSSPTLAPGSDGNKAEEICQVKDKDMDECASLVDGKSQEVKDTKSKPDDSMSNQEQSMDTSTHYHDDGSCFYMLTPAILPPSTDEVNKWLFNNETDVLRENVIALKEESLSPKGSLEPLVYSSSMSDIKTNLDHAKKLGKENHVMRPKTCSPGLASVPQDVSQLSGPEGKKLTPLSQAGFKDPASIGAGQQLTMLSIEVQAESRGDLRPDPRFDAISFIVVVIAEDDESATSSYVILHSEMTSVRRNIDGISDCTFIVCHQEKQLFDEFMKIISNHDPDILMGWDIQGGSLGFLAERAAFLGIGLLNKISRTPSQPILNPGVSDIPDKVTTGDVLLEPVDSQTDMLNEAIIDDEWGRTHASGVHVGGRIVLNVWRLVRSEVKLNIYTAEGVAEAVLRRKIPFINFRTLTKWFASGPGKARYRCIEYILERGKLNFQVMNQLDMINRTSELARVFGIDFFSVLSRGSQYRVESMLLRLAHTQNYLAISPGSQQVAFQPAMECLPLVMEPESGFYADPVIVLDFQSLYPSMVIAYNLCFCTCLGKVSPSKPNTLGVTSYTPDPNILRRLKHEVLLTPNGVMYAPSKVRKGVLPRLLDEILSTRIMVKQAMKKLSSSDKVLYRIYNARQLALKLIANVTYGYTAAGFSGRMPCAELADSIVQCGRRTLENAISLVNTHNKWKAKVIYGDTDSMFVLVPGRSVSEAFQIGNEIALAVTKMNPSPVVLKMEKVYQSCFLLTKKRYVGYSYEKPDQLKPVFDAKGIETVRRDTCPAVSKTMERSLRNYFENQDINKVKSYLVRQWSRILSGRVSIQDFIFAKEVRLGTYSSRVSSLPPSAIVATKAIKTDPRAEPRYAERIPYVVIHAEPGARLVDMVVNPTELLAIDSPYRLNDMYYINKQIIPALQRVFGLVGVDIRQWFLDMPRPVRESFGKNQAFGSNSNRTRIDYYYLSKHCIMCGEKVQASATPLCGKCERNEGAVAVAVTTRTSKMEKEIQHLAAICRHCGGADWIVESGIKCTSLACSVFYERQKVQKELRSLSNFATELGLYPKCMAEWF
ncbi:DNA polymerase zeta catalytic subunit-like [Bidens hawaiensis]|uniref:DNA polymerase zeta catalytic subunit-like n=1 Tax=Bidens hawaiensis TaxID=980011 RepID=UPI0040499179